MFSQEMDSSARSLISALTVTGPHEGILRSDCHLHGEHTELSPQRVAVGESQSLACSHLLMTQVSGRQECSVGVPETLAVALSHRNCNNNLKNEQSIGYDWLP